MALIRPEVAQALHRWRAVILAGALVLLGLRIGLMGGLVLAALGALVAAVGIGLGIDGLRRLRFRRDVTDPGIVQVVEAQITYFGPAEGGFAGLSTLTELALAQHGGRRCWRLKQAGGEVLHIPIAAEGAELLFDAFTGLPGLEAQTLLDALDGPAEMARIVWRRRTARLLH